MSRWFLSFVRPYVPRLALGFVLLLVTNGLALWIPWLLRDAIHAMEAGDGLDVVARLALAMAGVAAAQGVVRTWSRLAILGASRRIAHDVRERFYHRIVRLGASWFDAQRTGDVMSRGVNDIRLIQGFFGPGVMNLLNTTIVYVATVALLFRLDVRLTLISLTLYPPLLFAVNRLSRRVYSRSVAVQEQLGEISNRAQENIAGIQQVKTFVQEDREIEGFRALSGEFRRRNLGLAALRGAMMSLIGVFTGAGTLIVLFVGGRAVIEGRLTFGDFVAFNAYLGQLIWPTIALGWIINTFQRGLGAMERVTEIIRSEPDVPPAVDEDPAAAQVPLAGAIEIRGLTFTHDGGGVPALQDVSLSIPAGSRVAIVGGVGSGKSTLADLIARIHPVPAGTLFLDGHDVNDLSVGAVRRAVGYVPQEAFLFSRSVRDNVALGAPGGVPANAVSDAEIERAIRTARLDGDLAGFPKGMHTVVGERGFTLSGGQRQRTTLARAVLRDPRILLLDDSLSSLDADTERAVLAELERTMDDRTTILITHRPSTLAAMDRVVVLEHGRVVEDGTHETLLAAGGEYARLFRRQQLEDRLEGA